MSKRQHRVELMPIALIVCAGALALPGVTLWAAWELFAGFDTERMTIVGSVTGCVAATVGLAFLRLTLRELRGGVGMTIDEGGIRRRGVFGRLDLAWDQIVASERLEFGVQRLSLSGGGSLRLCTYLFERRDALERLISGKLPTTKAPTASDDPPTSPVQ